MYPKYYIDANLEQAGEVECRLQEKKQYDYLITLTKHQLDEQKAKSGATSTSSTSSSGTSTSKQRHDLLPLGECADYR